MPWILYLKLLDALSFSYHLAFVAGVVVFT